jgi:hypothetical protein
MVMTNGGRKGAKLPTPKEDRDPVDQIHREPSRVRDIISSVLQGVVALLSLVVMFVSWQNMERSGVAASGAIWVLFGLVSWALWIRPLRRLSWRRAFVAAGVVTLLGPISLGWRTFARLARREPLPIRTGLAACSPLSAQLYGGFVGLLIVVLVTGFH